VFLQLTCDSPEGVPIPGKPWSFGQVVAAQAAGDLAALKSRGRRAATVNVGRDVAAGLSRIETAVKSAISG
jgi:hypothetical protein